MKASLIFFIIVALFTGCMPLPVGFFEVNGYIRPFEESFNDKITFVFEEGVQDDFIISRMKVSQFRESLKLSLYYTFVNSFREVKFSDKIDSTGLTVVLYRVRPGFEVKSALANTYGGEDYVITDYTYDLSMLMRYDGIICKDGI